MSSPLKPLKRAKSTRPCFRSPTPIYSNDVLIANFPELKQPNGMTRSIHLYLAHQYHVFFIQSCIIREETRLLCIQKALQISRANVGLQYHV